MPADTETRIRTHPGLALLTAACLAAALPACGPAGTADFEAWADPQLTSLTDLSIEVLRGRPYGSVIRPLRTLPESASKGLALLAEYRSDGLRVYTRVDIPRGAPPPGGFPVVIFVHGWYGIEAAPGFDFFTGEDSTYARLLDHYVDAGFVVLSPALRGHGTVDGQAADGIEFLERWDNGSYLSPAWYAIDVLNLLDGIGSLESAEWREAAETAAPLRLDRDRISISGHSQGGDAVLMALAVSGEGSSVRLPLAAGSIWSGCFAPRVEQAAVYGPMAETLEAFMSGDGSWTGSAVGRNGSVNPDFVFGYPPDWIGTVDTRSPEWTWQADTWSTPTVEASLRRKFNEMYEALNRGIDDLDDVAYALEQDSAGRTRAVHDPRVLDGLRAIGGYDSPGYLSEPLHLHYSDQDYYSPPAWNVELAARIETAGGSVEAFVYPQNTHALGLSPYAWFQQGEVVAGFPYMAWRDVRLFRSGRAVDPDREDRTSIAALRRYAGALRNEFALAYQRTPIDGMPRKVVRFTADGLEQFALVVEPAGEAPDRGWPVLVMNHGYHPDPPQNGRRADGTTDRPGDYYRGLPEAYAREGFLVVWPDYRGHNVSQGGEYTRRPDAALWYARDTISAVAAVASLARADVENVFLWGHSIGGGIALRAALALGESVRGASIWSGGALSGPEPGLESLDAPLIILHAVGDATHPAAWSQELHDRARNSGAYSELLLFESDQHLFAEPHRQKAILEDIRFFGRMTNFE
jgi:dienelactone hydrolase